MANFTESRGWKLFMGKLYGLGAAVVIVGALFKLEHFPGASIMLIVGMSVEAFIFICSAFEPLPHPEPRWELVYPELAGGIAAEHGVAAPKEKHKKKLAVENIEVATVATGSNEKEAAATTAGSKVGKSGVAALAALGNIDLGKINVEKLASGLNKLGETTEKLAALSDTAVAANTLSEKMHHASLTVDNFSQSYETSSQSLSESMHTLSDSYQSSAEAVSTSGKQLGDEMSKAGKQITTDLGEAAENFAKSLAGSGKQISEEVSKTNRQVSEVMGVTVENFAKAIDDSSRQIISETGKANKQMIATVIGATEEAVKFIGNAGKSVSNEIAETSKQMSEVIGSAAESFAATFTLIDQHLKDNLSGINKGNSTYNKQVEALNKNMTTLNAVYELQVQESGKYHKNTTVMGQHLEKFVEELNHSVEGNRNFSKGITQLNKNIGELNGIYGSMLSAVQLATGKK
ncbi:MAG: gliding motility protein GldL [Prevotellaceae bacterium]|jgi:gliding motility-associated protein GldL|nr:gliding motility protein GldL [Prevotellaceae bacterium]